MADNLRIAGNRITMLLIIRGLDVWWYFTNPNINVKSASPSMIQIRPEHHWLLDRACVVGVHIRLLLPETLEQISQWNRPCPGWDQHGLFAGLRELEDAGLITFFHQVSEDAERERISQPSFSARQLMRDYKEGRWVYFELTELGGLAWEEAARPDWSRYYNRVWTDENWAARETEGTVEETLIIRAANENTARQAVFDTAYSQAYLMVAGSEVYSPFEPWRATYWKSLPLGVEASCRVCSKRIDGFSILDLMPEETHRRHVLANRWLNDWYVRAEDPSFLRRPDPRWWPNES